jgi:hypothetical protein
MGVYSENRQTGKVPYAQMTPAQQRQFKEFQRRGIEARRKKKGVENIAEGVETGLNVGFGSAALAGGVKSFAGAAPKLMKRRVFKYGGGAMNVALGTLMLGDAISGVYNKLRGKKPKPVEEKKFSARKWAEPV